MINRSGRLKIDDQFALIARVNNKSYPYRVFYTADELVSRSLINLDAREVGIRFPLNSNKFVGWDHLHRCREVTMIDAHQADWQKILTSVNVRRFDSCLGLELDGCFDFDFEIIAELFPAVRYVIIDGCYYMKLSGIERCQKLETIEFRNIIRPIEITDAPSELSEIIFTNCGQPKVAKRVTDQGVTIDIRYGSSAKGSVVKSL
ncbi:hypothetical protein ACVME8_008841 [Bradyrhizobium diazoefficiens]